MIDFDLREFKQNLGNPLTRRVSVQQRLHGTPPLSGGSFPNALSYPFILPSTTIVGMQLDLTNQTKGNSWQLELLPTAVRDQYNRIA